jgi:hypothetical protein
VASSATYETAAGVGTRRGPRARARSHPLLRLGTRLRRPWLDRDIGLGVERAGDRHLALRTAQLVDAKERRRLARRLEEVLDRRAGRPGPGSVVPVDRRAVAAARPVLSGLIHTLHSPEPVEARGMVLAWRLFTDPVSPLYARQGDGDRLLQESLAVLFALRGLP